MSFYEVCSAVCDWLWGTPILIVLVGGGIVLMIISRAFQFTKAGTVWRNTIGTLFDKEEQAKRKAKGISPLQAFFASLGCTVGTGNIVGVGAAIAVGGPGALFWMWICGILAMGIKYSEVLLSLKYREKNSADEGYRAGGYAYIKNGLHNKPLAIIFTILFMICNVVICLVHTSSMCTSAETLGVPTLVTTLVTVVLLVVIALGGMRGLVRVTDVIVPFMSVLYILATLIIIVLNAGKLPECFRLIFQGAFSGTAALGGFTGATFATVLSTGLARGVFSNDAGLGATAFLMSQAEDVKHPAEVASWSVVETFVDTLLICTLSGLVIILTGNWTVADDGSGLARMAMEGTFGVVGKVIICVSLMLFAFSTMIAILECNRTAAECLYKKKWFGIAFEMLAVLFVIISLFVNLDAAFMYTDLANVIVLIINVIVMICLGKDIRKSTDEWFFHPTDAIKKLQIQKKAKKAD